MTDDRGGVPAPSPGAGAPRRFREDEVAAILGRAAAAESRTDLPAPHDPTLADLMEAARQVGLDPAEVRRAAAIRPFEPAEVATTVLGAPDQREARAVLEGATPPADSTAVVAGLEAALGRSGKVSAHNGNGFTWQESHTGGSTTVAVRRASGADPALEVSATAHRAGHYLATWFVALVAWAAAAALTPLGTLPLAAQAVGFLLGPFVVARPFWTRADRRLRRRLEQAVLAVLREAEEAGGEE